MKLSTDGDTVTVETGREDKQLAEAAAEVVSGTVDLANAIGVRSCEWCDDRARLRPYQLTVDGTFKVLDICGECQTSFVEDAAEQEREQSRSTIHGDIGDADA